MGPPRPGGGAIGRGGNPRLAPWRTLPAIRRGRTIDLGMGARAVPSGCSIARLQGGTAFPHRRTAVLRSPTQRRSISPTDDPAILSPVASACTTSGCAPRERLTAFLALRKQRRACCTLMQPARRGTSEPGGATDRPVRPSYRAGRLRVRVKQLGALTPG